MHLQSRSVSCGTILFQYRIVNGGYLTVSLLSLPALPYTSVAIFSPPLSDIFILAHVRRVLNPVQMVNLTSIKVVAIFIMFAVAFVGGLVPTRLNRNNGMLRPIAFAKGKIQFAEGSVLLILTIPTEGAGFGGVQPIC